jgi:signal transduction histidine kinase
MEKEDDFQTVNMVYKLEKIKKRKAKKYPKKMDLFETLDNPVGDIKKSILTGGSKKSIIEPFDQNVTSEKTKTIEGLEMLKSTDFEGVKEDIKRGSGKGVGGKDVNFKDDLLAFIRGTQNAINGFNRHIAIFIAIAASSKLPREVNSISDERKYWGLEKTNKTLNKNNGGFLKSFGDQLQKISDSVNEDVAKNLKEGFSWDLVSEDAKNNAAAIKNSAESNTANQDDEDKNDGVDVLKETKKKVVSAANSLLGGKVIDEGASQSDIDLIQKYIGWFEAVLLSSYAVYNWYFLMFYLERGAGNNDDDNDKRFRFSTKYLDDLYHERIPPNPNISSGTAFLLLFLFEFPIFFPEMLDKFLFDVVPKNSKKILNGAFCFIILFYLITYIFIKFFNQFMQFYIDYLSGNLKNPLIGIVLAIMIVLYLLSLGKFFSPVKSQADTLIAEMGVAFTNKFGKAGKAADETAKDAARYALTEAKLKNEANKIASSAKKYNVFSILNFILFTVLARLLVIIFIGVPVAALFIGLYIVIYSFFGIFIYGEVRSIGLNNLFGAIIAHIENNKGDDFNEEDDSYYKSVRTLVNKFSIIAYEKIFTIGYLIVLLLAASDFLNLSNIKSVLPIKSIKMKELLIMLIIIIAVAVASYTYNSIDFKKILDKIGEEDKKKASVAEESYNKFQQAQKERDSVEEAKKSVYIERRISAEKEREKTMGVTGKALNLFGFGTNTNLLNKVSSAVGYNNPSFDAKIDTTGINEDIAERAKEISEGKKPIPKTK